MLLSKLVKAALTLSHGCASVERDFSLPGILFLSDRASISERVLNAKLCVTDKFNTWRPIRNVSNC